MLTKASRAVLWGCVALTLRRWGVLPTQYWKSNAHYWCELCRVWMTDKQSTRATHEAGVKHQELLQKSASARASPPSHLAAAEGLRASLPALSGKMIGCMRMESHMSIFYLYAGILSRSVKIQQACSDTG